MADIRAVDIDAVVFDILGTLVDEPGGLRAEIRDALSASGGGPDGGSDDSVDELLAVWQRHVESEQRRIGQRERAYADSEVIDREAAGRVADRAGLTDPAAIERLATASRLSALRGATPPPVSNGSRGGSRCSGSPTPHTSRCSTSTRTPGCAGTKSCPAKPSWPTSRPRRSTGSPSTPCGCPPERVLMVAAHAWDLRGARARGMRTAYVRRPVGDPPTDADAFDGRFDGLEDLVNTLTAR